MQGHMLPLAQSLEKLHLSGMSSGMLEAYRTLHYMYTLTLVCVGRIVPKLSVAAASLGEDDSEGESEGGE